jgi:iron(III) transport system permease protein
MLAWIARQPWGRIVSLAVVAIALVLPGPLLGIGLIGLFHIVDWPPLVWLYDRSITAPVLAQAVRALPLAALILWQGVSSVPQELIDAARIDGANRWQMFARVMMPLTWPSMVAAWLVALAVAAGDLAASILVVPPGVETLAIHVFGLIHFGVDDRVAGVTLFTIASYAAIAFVFRRFLAPTNGVIGSLSSANGK